MDRSTNSRRKRLSQDGSTICILYISFSGNDIGFPSFFLSFFFFFFFFGGGGVFGPVRRRRVESPKSLRASPSPVLTRTTPWRGHSRFFVEWTSDHRGHTPVVSVTVVVHGHCQVCELCPVTLSVDTVSWLSLRTLCIDFVCEHCLVTLSLNTVS